MQRVLVGVSGGIAAYKIPDLIRDLKRQNFQVKVILTPFAENFVTKLTFATISDGAYTDEDWKDKPLLHIELARWADVFLIAPATANTVGKIKNGIADNLLLTTILAHKKPLLIAPAMNTVMYKSPQVQENLRKLKEWNHIIIEPEFGVLACEEVGEGKLASKERLIDWIHYSLEPKDLKGLKVLITCGATREFIDPVRYLSNLSSGEMGFSLARVARWKGAKVKVIAGHTSAPEPPEVEIIRVNTTQEMREEVLRHYDWADVVVMNAAVSDFRPAKVSQKKIKKQEKLTLELVKNPDILEELGKKKKHQFLVGFALESENLLEYGKEKLQRKNLDMLIANPIKSMGSKDHEGLLITPEGVEEFSFPTKLESARFIWNKIAQRLSKRP